MRHGEINMGSSARVSCEVDSALTSSAHSDSRELRSDEYQHATALLTGFDGPVHVQPGAHSHGALEPRNDKHLRYA